MQLLTYRPDDGLPDEDPEPSHEEREVVLPSDDVVLVSEDTEPSPPPPPPSASTQSQNIIDTDDLLVKLLLCLLYEYLSQFCFDILNFSLFNFPHRV